MALCCGNKEFKTWEEADLFIEEFNQREKERQEEAFYYWQNLHIKNIITSGVIGGIAFTRTIEKMKETEGLTEEVLKDEVFQAEVIEEIIEFVFNETMKMIDPDISKKIHTGKRMLVLS